MQPINKNALRQAAAYVQAGKLVAFPTETVYGLGADATNDTAVAAIFAAKGRPRFNPLIVHVADSTKAQQYGRWNKTAQKLAENCWPGPLAIVVRRKKDSPLSLLVSAGTDTVALRVPGHAGAQALLRAAGCPIAAPSANRSGRISPTRAEHVQEELGGAVSLILDGGACQEGVESTVVDCTQEPAVLLRPGAISRERLQAVLGRAVADKPQQMEKSHGLASPGLLSSHYAPSLPVALHVTQPQHNDAYLAFGPKVPEGAAVTLNLSPAGDLKEAAANLFAMLRALDKPCYRRIAVMPIPPEGLGEAINDRLQRAAADRPS